MERYVNFEKGEYYHIFNRGVEKRKIFYSSADWIYFQRLLYIRNDATGHIRPERSKDTPLSKLEVREPLVNIQAYALMPNHFHLMLSESVPGGITTYMRRLLTSYSMYMNKKYNRTGPLMSRPFRSRHIDSDDYLRWVISYIHLNPLELHAPDWKEKKVRDKTGAQKFLAGYRYSSYSDYYGEQRDESVILNKESLPIFISELENINEMISKVNSLVV